MTSVSRRMKAATICRTTSRCFLRRRFAASHCSAASTAYATTSRHQKAHFLLSSSPPCHRSRCPLLQPSPVTTAAVPCRSTLQIRGRSDLFHPPLTSLRIRGRSSAHTGAKPFAATASQPASCCRSALPLGSEPTAAISRCFPAVASSSSNSIENKETLKASAVVCELPDAIEAEIHDLLTDGVVACKVVCSIFLATD
ncbi:hypothetical protein OPV22_032388 [Ensete ventricosum]|uniref:Uncharacterized protein n=1 Tax=Ensete ventricosum TaxID=4639 RepID=A0AAV8PWG1_ENSVE|nr:hypothetical protein OPV22_032388 [Ensete ventricosum]